MNKVYVLRKKCFNDLTKIKNLIQTNKRSKLTFQRDLNINKNLVGSTLNVYQGKRFIDLHINTDMVGFKVGSFSLTRSRFFYKKDKKKNK